MKIRELTLKDLPAVKNFADQNIGLNYFSLAELTEGLKKSSSQGRVCSFVLVDESKAPEQILGLRLTYAPGLWTQGKGAQLRPDLWRVPADKAAYFQSLFIAEEIQGQGWGPRLTAASLKVLKDLQTQAVITHAWKESPNNSSIRYLLKQGFQSIATHPLYWFSLDYECVLDGRPCRCTAEEMILYLARLP